MSATWTPRASGSSKPPRRTRRRAARPINVIGSELEALRIDIMQGQVAAALPQVEARLAQVAAWWQRHRSGQQCPEAPDAEVLARAFISALDIAREADYARQDWESALRRLDAILEVKRALERPAEDIAATRLNRANVLRNLGRFGEARAELEDCLQLFQNNPATSAKVLSSLADLFDRQGDVAQAITQERRALALCEQLPDPADRAISHNNLANYLERHGTPSALAESPRHQLAALIYCLVAGLGQHLQTSLRNYAIAFPPRPRRRHRVGRAPRGRTARRPRLSPARPVAPPAPGGRGRTASRRGSVPRTGAASGAETAT